ncbi:MAG TPA: hypothetical protein PLH94_05180 [Fimbriimonadaceae bacterium]|nr:hypothetical protein [Fimbriimonadaceae bacterium]
MPDPTTQPTSDEEATPSPKTMDTADALRGLLKEMSDTDTTHSPGARRHDQPSKEEARIQKP